MTSKDWLENVVSEYNWFEYYCYHSHEDVKTCISLVTQGRTCFLVLHSGFPVFPEDSNNNNNNNLHTIALYLASLQKLIHLIL